VVIEDAPVGVQAGVAAGMTVLGLEGTHPAERLRAAGAVDVVSQLSAVTAARVTALLAR
jgi:beta-phosphoglucomutase-like phosphatase (HAD superfamily)